MKYKMLPQIIVSCVREVVELQPIIKTPEDSYRIWQDHVFRALDFEADKECFIVLALNRRYRITLWNKVSVGLLDTCLVHPREVFRPVIVAGACSLVLMHNHPSGDLTPSSEDLCITRQIVEAGKVVGIEVLDHVIVSTPKQDARAFCSLRESGLVNFA